MRYRWMVTITGFNPEFRSALIQRNTIRKELGGEFPIRAEVIYDPKSDATILWANKLPYLLIKRFTYAKRERFEVPY